MPLSEVFTTREGNHIQRLDKGKATLAGIEMDVGPKPNSGPPVNTAKVLSQIPTAAFTGPVNGRDKLVLQLLQKGKDANGASEFAQACACFEAAYALSVRGGMLVSAANMRLKLGEAETAAAMYRSVLSDSGLLEPEREMAARKLAEAQALLPAEAPKAAKPSAKKAGSGFEGGFDADFGDDDGFGDFDDAPVPPRQAASKQPPPPPQPAFAASFGDGGGDDEDFDDADFGDFDDSPPPSKPPAIAKPAMAPAVALAKPPAATTTTDTFGDFDADFGDVDSFESAAPAPPPPKPTKPKPVVALAPPSAPSGGGFDGGFDADFGDAPPTAAAIKPPTSIRPSVASSGPVDGDAVSRLEARLARLEETVRGGPSKLTVVEHGEKIDRLSAQVERRMAGVRKGMEALNGRLAAVETAMAKLPEHLKSFKSKNKEAARLGKEHSDQIAALQLAIPSLGHVANECRHRINELQKLSVALASGPEAALEFAASLPPVEESITPPPPPPPAMPAVDVSAELGSSSSSVPPPPPSEAMLNGGMTAGAPLPADMFGSTMGGGGGGGVAADPMSPQLMMMSPALGIMGGGDALPSTSSMVPPPAAANVLLEPAKDPVGMSDGFAAFSEPTPPPPPLPVPVAPPQMDGFGDFGGTSDPAPVDSFAAFGSASEAATAIIDTATADATKAAEEAAAREAAAIREAAAAAAAEEEEDGFGDFDEADAEAEAQREMETALAAAKKQQEEAASSSTTNGNGDGGLDEAAALDAELEGARRERERVEMELAADTFLTSLTHTDDPKAAERAAAGPGDDLASDASVDDTAFNSFADGKQRGQSFDATIGATVTDDEFNALFGPTE